MWERIKIIMEINEMDSSETIENISKSKSCFFEKINKIGKPLSRLTKEGEREGDSSY